jgi:hypothetical protein
MYVLMIVEYGMRILLFELKSIQTTATSSGRTGDFIILPLATVMLLLSLKDASKA